MLNISMYLATSLAMPCPLYLGSTTTYPEVRTGFRLLHKGAEKGKWMRITFHFQCWWTSAWCPRCLGSNSIAPKLEFFCLSHLYGFGKRKLTCVSFSLKIFYFGSALFISAADGWAPRQRSSHTSLNFYDCVNHFLYCNCPLSTMQDITQWLVHAIAIVEWATGVIWP